MFTHSRHKIENIIRIRYDNPDYYSYYDSQEKIYNTILYKCKYIPEMTFKDYVIEVPYCGRSLDLIKKKTIDIDDKCAIKHQLIDFVRFMYKENIAHRDLWQKNICWDGKQIWVIDWEYVIEHSPNTIQEHYDLTGMGLESPEETSNMNIFHQNKFSMINCMSPLPLNLEDF